MIPETYLEYLSLDSILQGYISASELTLNAPPQCKMWFADDSTAILNLKKLKERVATLQRDFLKDYICTDNTLKKD